MANKPNELANLDPVTLKRVKEELKDSYIEILETPGTYAQLKTALGENSIGTIKSRLSRARAALNELLEPRRP